MINYLDHIKQTPDCLIGVKDYTQPIWRKPAAFIVNQYVLGDHRFFW